MTLPFTIDQRIWLVILPIIAFSYIIYFGKNKLARYIQNLFKTMYLSRVKNFSELSKSDQQKALRILNYFFHFGMALLIIGSILSLLIFVDVLQNPQKDFGKVNMDDYELIITDNMLKAIKKEEK